ncbi:MAG: drug/metabolite transporter (DMT)-like permease [Motiliproteus sp.]|jgi:drug/metabolite transporter (DMT)-like permease
MSRYLPQLLLVLTTLFWAGNFVVARATHLSMPPLSLSFWRWLLALLILLPWVAPKLVSERALIFKHWKILLLLSVLGVVNFNSFIYLGLQYTTATNATLLQSVVPSLVMLLAVFLLGQKISRLQAVGLALSLLGVLCIVLRGDLTQLLNLEINRGDLWVLTGMLSWSLYTVALHWRPVALSKGALLGSTILTGTLVLLPVYLWELGQGLRIALVSENLLALGYVAIFPSVMAYFFWNYGVEKLGAPRAGLFIYLLPVFGTTLSMLFLGEQPALYHLFGFALVLAGMLLAIRHRPEPKQG